MVGSLACAWGYHIILRIEYHRHAAEIGDPVDRRADILLWAVNFTTFGKAQILGPLTGFQHDEEPSAKVISDATLLIPISTLSKSGHYLVNVYAYIFLGTPGQSPGSSRPFRG